MRRDISVMKLLLYTYRVFLCLLILFLCGCGFKYLMTISDNILYWGVIAIVFVGILFVIYDLFRAKKIGEPSKNNYKFENYENLRCEILDKLKSNFPFGHISENRVFAVFSDDKTRFAYCDVYKNVFGISDCDFKLFLSDLSVEERVLKFTLQLNNLINGKTVIVSAYDKDGVLITSSFCDEKNAKSVIKKISSPFSQLNFFEKVICAIFLVFPQNPHKIYIERFDGRKEAVTHD